MLAETSSVVSITALGRALRSAWYIPFGMAALFFIVACIYLWLATPLYEARVTITSRPVKGSGSLPEFSSLGLDLLGSLGTSGTLTSYDKLIEILSSEDAATQLLKNKVLMPKLFPEIWDNEHSRWIPSTGLRAQLGQSLNRVFGLPGWAQPGAEPIMALLSDRLRIVANDNGRTHTLIMRDPNALVAHDTLAYILKTSDGLLRERDRRTNSDNVAFIRSQLIKEQILDVRDVLSRRLGEEFVSSTMLANSSSYSYEILKGVVVSSRPVSPRPLLTLILSVLGGMIVGAGVLILLRRDWRHSEQIS